MIIPIQFVGCTPDDGGGSGAGGSAHAADAEPKKPSGERPSQKLRQEVKELKEKIAKLEASLKAATDEAAECKADAAANYELAQRKQAESENTRKRAAKEEQQFRRYANEAILVDFFPVLDSLRQALSHAEGREDPLTQGLAKTADILARALKKHGVTPIDDAPVPFDPSRHSALNTETRTDYPDNTVIEVYAPGYMLADRVIKPALVRVAVGGPPAGGDGTLDAPEPVGQAKDDDMETDEVTEERHESAESEETRDDE